MPPSDKALNERSQTTISSTVQPRQDPLPESIGPYKILERIGEGGMGIVYLAEQSKPLRRRVALKVIKPGMDSKTVIARFEAERQALALMDHPGVARIFDAGTTDQGRPYFAMEHVAGVPITEHCDRQKLNIEERLNLYMEVCEGVQHAHQKGVIHRDIKPSNILVAIKDGKSQAKVIDFGVAKAMDHRLTEGTMFTEQGQIIGTPSYMSPEQAEMTAQDVDTRTDIYSLGVLLYELLTGALPFDPKSLLHAAFDEIRRIIREDQPRKPSTKLSDMSGDNDTDSTTAARNRHTSPDVLTRRLRGDLDWVTMKALEKDRTRRYATATEFAADIRRHLNHEPVVAGPPSPIYRLGKFARRRRMPIVAVTVILVAIGFAVNSQMAASRLKLETSRLELEKSRLELTATGAALAVAQAAAAEMGETATDLQDNLQKVIELCTAAIKFQPNNAMAYAIRAKAYKRRYGYDQAWTDARKALALDPDNSLALRTLGFLHCIKDNHTEALDAYNRGITALQDRNEYMAEDFHMRASLHRHFGDYEAALTDHNAAIALAPNEAKLYGSRAVTRRFLGDVTGAIDDLSHAMPLDKTWDLQCNLWIWEMLILRAAPGDKEAAETALVAASQAEPDEPFDRMYARICSGDLTSAEALRKADTDTQRKIERRFFATYYLGARALARGRLDDAKTWFGQCTSSDFRGPSDIEREFATWHLDRISSN